MAGGQRIEIPINLSAQIENLREIRQTLITTLNAAGKDSSLAKSLTKDLLKVNQMLGQVEDFALSPTIDEAGLKSLKQVLDKFYKQAQTSFSNIDFANFESIASEDEIAKLKALTTEAAKYHKELESLKRTGSQERTDAHLLKIGQEKLLGKAQAQKGFDSTASLAKNALAMERASESYQRSADSMQAAMDKLESEANAAITNAQQAAQQVKTLEQQSQTLAADTQAAKFHHAAGRFKTAIVANRGVENPTINSVERGLRSALESVQANGKIATDARNAVGEWIQQLFPQLPTNDIAAMVGQDINTLLSDLMKRIFGSGYLDEDVVYSAQHSAILGRGQKYSKDEINRIASAHSTANVLDLTASKQQVDSKLRAARTSYTAYNNEADSKLTSWMEMSDQQSELTAAAQATSELSKELYTLADAAQEAAVAAKQMQIQQNATAQEALRGGVVNRVRTQGKKGYKDVQEQLPNMQSFIGDVDEAMKAAKTQSQEAEQFTNQLQQSISHWMSASQIVNLVKDGIRQAYQDIQALDATMANIAVVTDMSVSDLWSKVNDYMSIAQEYGVTTQGVYEVSQLYYQQGLGTKEVLVATTETLKLARIAGMGYAEAADAMTVAIRSFKMEMTDAQRVTDVYSKVAAITASDSEELAIAMSKTASSAESVGSSFENTTAMLGVMIETTRESAQNLGSALKSIISRYGEMKEGRTVDEEGEAIYYNKVDEALASVGVSLKDAQGQFRDFDDVIFELSSKWDSLDKNTQRYIATIMAGNRQQSRFIALVDNWERLDEVATSAQDSEDAGLLQYAKTIDTLQTKLNNLGTTFQSFYMSIINGESIKGFVDIITNIVNHFSRLGPLLGGINLLNFIGQIKTVGKLLINIFKQPAATVKEAVTSWEQTMLNGNWSSVGEWIAQVIGSKLKTGIQQSIQESTQAPAGIAPQTQAQALAGGLSGLKAGGMLTVNAAVLADNYEAQANKILANKASSSPEAIAWAESVQQSCAVWTKAVQSGADAEQDAANEQLIKDLAAADQKQQKEQQAGENFKQKVGNAGEEFKADVNAAGQQIGTKGKLSGAIKKVGARNVVGGIATAAGSALSMAGMMHDTSTMSGYDTATRLNVAGGLLSGAGSMIMGGPIGWITGAIQIISTIITLVQQISQRDMVALQNAEKAEKEAQAKRAETQNEARELESTIENLKRLQAARYDSEEAAQAFIEASNAAAEKFPQLVSGYDSMGNAIVDVISETSSAEYLLIAARLEAAEAANQAAAAEAKAARLRTEDSKKSKDEADNKMKEKLGALDIGKDSEAYEEVFGSGFSVTEEMLGSNEHQYWSLIARFFEDTNMPSFTKDDWVSKLGSLGISFDSGAWDAAMEAYASGDYAPLVGLISDIYTKFAGIDPMTLYETFQGKPAATLDDANAFRSEILTKLDKRFDLQPDDSVIPSLLESTSKYSSVQLDYDLKKTAEYNSKKAVLRENARSINTESFVQDSVWQEVVGLQDLIVENAIAGIDAEAAVLYNANGNPYVDGSYASEIGTYMEQASASINAYWSGLLGEQQKEIVKQIINDIKAGKVSSAELESYVRSFGVNYSSDFYSIFTDNLLTQETASRELLINKLLESSQQKVRMSSYEDWLGSEEAESYLSKVGEGKDYSTKLQAYDAWQKQQIDDYATLLNNDNPLYAEILENLTDMSAQESSMLLSYFSREEDVISSSDQFGQEIAESRREKMLEGYLRLRESTEDPALLGKIREAIFAGDSGSIDWYQRIVNDEELLDSLESVGLTADSLLEMVYTTLNTRIHTGIEQMQGYLDKSKALYEKNADEGYNMLEAWDLYEELGGLEAGEFDTVFELKDGKYYLKDVKAAQQKLYDENMEILTSTNEGFEALLSNIDSVTINVPTETLDYDEATAQAGEILKKLGVDVAQFQQEHNDIYSEFVQKLLDGEFKTQEDIENWLRTRYEQTEESLEYFSAVNEEQSKTFAVDSWAKSKIKTPEYTFEGTEGTKALGDIIASALPEEIYTNDTLLHGIINKVSSEMQEAGIAFINENGELIIQNASAAIDFIESYTGTELSSADKMSIYALQGSLETLEEQATESVGTLYSSIIEEGSISLEAVLGTLGTLKSLGVEEEALVGILDKYGSLKDLTLAQMFALVNDIMAVATNAGIEVDYTAINDAMDAALQAMIDTLAEALKAGVEGTLSSEEFHKLQERYGLQNITGVKTASGWSLSASSQEVLMKDITSALASNGSVVDVGARVLEIGREAGIEMFESYTGIEEALVKATEEAKALEASSDKNAAAAWDYVDALRAAAGAAKLDADSYEFNFMDQEATDGLTDNFDNYVDTIGKVKNVFAAFSSGAKVSYQDFYNLTDFLQKHGGKGFKALAAAAANAGMDFETFVNTVVEKHSELGQVDIGGVALELGISVEEASKLMSEGMSEGLQQVAKDQIEYLTGIENMLVAMSALDGLSAEMDIEVKATINNKQFDSWDSIAEYYKGLTDDSQREAFIQSLEGQLTDNAKVLFDLVKSGGITEAEFNMLNQITEWWNKPENEGQRQHLIDNIQNLTQEQAMWLVEAYTNDLPGLIEHLLDGKPIGESYYSQLAAIFAGQQTISINDGKLTLQWNDSNSIQIEGLDSDGLTEELRNEVNSILGKEGLELGADLGNGVFGVQAKVEVSEPEVPLGEQIGQAMAKALTDLDLTIDTAEYDGAMAGAIEKAQELKSLLESINELGLNPARVFEALESGGLDASIDAAKSVLNGIPKDMRMMIGARAAKSIGDVTVEDIQKYGGLVLEEWKALHSSKKSGKPSSKKSEGSETTEEPKPGTGGGAASEGTTNSRWSGGFYAGNPVLPILTKEELTEAVAELPDTRASGDTTSSEEPEGSGTAEEPRPGAEEEPASEDTPKFKEFNWNVPLALDDPKARSTKILAPENTGKGTGHVTFEDIATTTFNTQEPSAGAGQTMLDFLGQGQDWFTGIFTPKSVEITTDNTTVETDDSNPPPSEETSTPPDITWNDFIPLYEEKWGEYGFSYGDTIGTLKNYYQGSYEGFDFANEVIGKAMDSSGLVSTDWLELNPTELTAQIMEVANGVKQDPVELPFDVNTFEADQKLNEFAAKASSTPIILTAGFRIGNIPQMRWSGNVNNLSGAALAEGNATERLLAGANLANKTLVGELGPELAVYNGKYHLLGADGAEFVNLPDDAIVFNHLQTAGIFKGQMNVRGKALASGNVSGPAMAGGGISEALAAVRRAKSVWQGLLDDLSAAELLGEGGGGGGGGGGISATIEDLEEWYNLSRKIAVLEQEINNILAKRENILDGSDYLLSLRQQEKLLHEQAETQKTLLYYQERQLERQRDEILAHDIWSQFLTINDRGVLQYIEGNETNGGKGALKVLDELNKMSGEEQVEFMKNLGYSYTDQDGNELKDAELVAKFYEELQKVIDDYDALGETVHSTQETLEGLETSIRDINDEIRENKMSLEEEIFDNLVSIWEKEIESLEEQKDLIEEANDAYVEGLNKALEAERDKYSLEDSNSEREELQRRLSLLRRSGGSASEIADLEKELDDILRDQYFERQEKMIEDIEEANETQIEKLEQQIKLQQEALDFEKENGVLWTKVYEILQGSYEDIYSFMQGSSPDFFSKSAEVQEDMLTEWAKKIGIYTADREHQNYMSEAEDYFNDSMNGSLKEYLNLFKKTLTDDERKGIQDLYGSTYATSRQEGLSHEEALAKAESAAKERLAALGGTYDENGKKKPEPVEKETDAKENKKKTRHYFVTPNGVRSPDYPTIEKREAALQARMNDTITAWQKEIDEYPGEARSAQLAASIRKWKDRKNWKIYSYSSGGLVDYTGVANVHGSPSKPEAFLNAKQTAMISEAVKIAGDGGALDGIKNTLSKLDSTIKSIITNNTHENTTFTISPGAVVINVEQLKDSYDVEELSKDVMNRMVAIASKATNRGVNRR